jgi:hypothetical protein
MHCTRIMSMVGRWSRRCILGYIWAEKLQSVVGTHRSETRRYHLTLLGIQNASTGVLRAADLSTGLASLCEDPMLRNDILMRNNAPIDCTENANLKWCFDSVETLRTKMTAEKLFPPGRILLLTGAQSSSLLPWRRSTNCKSSASLHEVPPEYFQDLVIGPRMVSCLRHFPSLYESTLKALASSQLTDCI